MTEQEWLSSTNPVTMLEALTIGRGDAFPEPFRRPSNRQLRLFACACCRLVWEGTTCQDCCALPEWADAKVKARVDELMAGGVFGDGIGAGNTARRINAEWGRAYTPEGIHAIWQRGKDWHTKACRTCNGTSKVGGLTDERSRRAVEVAERFADGEATEEELAQARGAASNARLPNWGHEKNPLHLPTWLAHVVTCETVASIISVVQRQDEMPMVVAPAVQAALIREIFGNPFRPVRIKRLDEPRFGWDINPEWLTPNVLAIAERAYGGKCERCEGRGHPLQPDDAPRAGRCAGGGRLHEQEYIASPAIVRAARPGLLGSGPNPQ